MIVETLAMTVIGLALLIGIAVSLMRGNTDGAVLLGVALLTGIWPLGALVLSAVLAVVFFARGDSRKAAFSLFGLILGMGLFVGVLTALVAGGLIEGTV